MGIGGQIRAAPSNALGIPPQASEAGVSFVAPGGSERLTDISRPVEKHQHQGQFEVRQG